MPAGANATGGVIVFKVILRQGGVQTFFKIAGIFLGNGVAVVFVVPHNKKLAAVFIAN